MEDGVHLDPNDVRDVLENKVKRVSKSDLEEVIGQEAEILEKAKKVPGELVKLVNQVKLLFEMLKDYWNGVYEELPWYTIATAVAAVIYFVSPIDLIPDFIPVIGYLDDAAVMALAIAGIREDLKVYCDFKGYTAEKYF